MRTRIIRRFLWSFFFWIAAVVASLALYVAQADPALLNAILIATLLIMLGGAMLAWLFVRAFQQRTTQLRAFAERLLEPGISGDRLPSADDELGALARALYDTAPRIRRLIDTLKLEGERRETILSSMVEGVLAVDPDLRVTFCNDSFARAVGAGIPVAAGVPLVELIRDPRLLEIMAQVAATGVRVERRLTLLTATSRSFDVLAGPLAGPATRGALAILHDVTELDRLERVRKDFVANVSHELRTPLAAIHGYAETLLSGALDDTVNRQKFVEIILAQAGRLTNIASDLLALSELESNTSMSLAPAISVQAALQSALRIVESSAHLRDVRLVLGHLEDRKVNARELRLEQVFVNLLDNAVKFNRPNGEVRVETRADNGLIRITIADTGLGIPSEDLPRIFERFYRVDKARSREMGGTGLGLSIVKHAIEQMGGTVTVDSRLGEGSLFTIEIPTVQPTS